MWRVEDGRVALSKFAGGLEEHCWSKGHAAGFDCQVEVRWVLREVEDFYFPIREIERRRVAQDRIFFGGEADVPGDDASERFKFCDGPQE